MDKLAGQIGCEVQVGTAYDLITGVLVSIDEILIMLRTSDKSGYDHGQHLIIQLSEVSFVRVP